MTMIRPLVINEVVNNQELCEVFLCAPQGECVNRIVRIR